MELLENHVETIFSTPEQLEAFIAHFGEDETAMYVREVCQERDLEMYGICPWF